MNALLAWYFVAVWGSGYLATKIGLQHAAPFTFLGLRFAFGLVVLLPILFFWRPAWPRDCELSAGARPFFPITRRAQLGDFERIVNEYPVFRVAPAV